MTDTSLAAVAGAAAGQKPVSEGATGAVADTVPRSDHETAVASAEIGGRAAGAEEERARLAAVLTADGIAGNLDRMNHAIELASEAPEMSSEKIVAMTVKHIPESAATTGADLAGRLSDSDPLGEVGGASPDKSAAQIDASAIYAVHNESR